MVGLDCIRCPRGAAGLQVARRYSDSRDCKQELLHETGKIYEDRSGADREAARDLQHLARSRFEPAGERHFALKVGKKTFAWYLNDHHGDGIESVCAKSTLARQHELVACDPRLYFVPAYVGKDGWVGLRIDLPRIDWGLVLELLVTAYRMQATKRLLAQLD